MKSSAVNLSVFQEQCVALHVLKKRRDTHIYWVNVKSHEIDQETKNKTFIWNYNWLHESVTVTWEFNYVSDNDLLLTVSQLVH